MTPRLPGESGTLAWVADDTEALLAEGMLPSAMQPERFASALATGWRTAARIAALWQLTPAEHAALVGRPADWTPSPAATLASDGPVLLRISRLLNCYASLRILYGRESANDDARRLRLPLPDAPFLGSSMLAFLTAHPDNLTRTLNYLYGQRFG